MFPFGQSLLLNVTVLMLVSQLGISQMNWLPSCKLSLKSALSAAAVSWHLFTQISLPLCPTGMPDFLEKLHTAALRAKNMDVGVHDYVSVVKPTQPTDNARTGGPNQIYAWASGHSDWYTVVKWPRTEHFSLMGSLIEATKKFEPSIPKINLCHWQVLY